MNITYINSLRWFDPFPYYGLSILTNTGSSEDVAILGGGLIREYLDLDERADCS